MTPDHPSRGWQFRPDIEGLRAVAILLVVGYHAGWPYLKGGFLGVDVFFVLSGFLITGILVSEVEDTGSVSLARFWSRRARRLLPASATVGLATLALASVGTSLFDQVNLGRSALATAVYASNLFFAREAGDYFARNVAENPFLHTWSLAVEEQYYLVFAPLTALVAWWVARRTPGRFRQRFGGLILALTVLSFVLCLAAVGTRPILAFYLLPTRAWELGIGCLLAVTRAPDRVKPGPHLGWISGAALAVMLLSVTVIDQRSTHPGLPTLAPVLSTAVLVLVGRAGGGTLIGRWLGSAPMRTLGRLSYSWYLWHWPAFVFLRQSVLNPTPLQLGAAAAVALVLAAATYVLVEGPVRFSPWLSRRPWIGLAGAVGYSLVLGFGALLLRTNAVRTLERADLAPLLHAQQQMPSVYRDGCHASSTDKEPPRICVYGSPDGHPRVLIFGDSHAAQWMPALERIAAWRGWRLVPLTKSGCPSIGVSVFSQAMRPYHECDLWRSSALTTIREEEPDLVIVSNAHDYELSVDGQPVTTRDPRALDLWHDAMVRTLRALTAMAPKVVVLRDTPRSPNDPLSCLATHPGDSTRCQVPREVAVNTLVARAEARAAASMPPTQVLDMLGFICDATECPAERDSMPLYRDKDHLSVEFSRSLARSLGPALDSLIRDPARFQPTGISPRSSW